ncbi:TPA: DNA repair protein rhp57 [Trebouxia sp. C0004]
MQPQTLTQGSLRRCTIGCSLLDKLLRGGIPCGSVTELVGEASAGKTQACLQLLITCQWPLDHGGLQGKAMYMYTEGDPSMKRLNAFMSASPHQASPANIYWERNIVDGEDLYRRLQDTEVIMRQPQGLPLRLLIIDSIAHLFRDIGDHTDASAYVRRTGMLFRLSALLRRFADTYNLAVVVTNQVSDAFTDADRTSNQKAPASKHTGGLRLLSSGRELVPALGLAWANCVNARLFLSRTEVTIASSCWQSSCDLIRNGSTPPSLPLRYMQVVFSPCLPQDTCLYVVTQTGLKGVDNASVGFQRQGVDSRQQPIQRPHRSGATGLASDAKVVDAHNSLQAEAVLHTSLCVSNRALDCTIPSQNVSKQTACKLATGVFAPG